MVEVEELEATELIDPMARLVFRVHLDASGTGYSVTGPVTACYSAAFNYYGVIGKPHRADCPEGAAAIVPPPLSPRPRIVIHMG